MCNLKPKTQDFSRVGGHTVPTHPRKILGFAHRIISVLHQVKAPFWGKLMRGAPSAFPKIGLLFAVQLYSNMQVGYVQGGQGQCPLRGGSIPTPRTAPKWVPL